MRSSSAISADALEAVPVGTGPETSNRRRRHRPSIGASIYPIRIIGYFLAGVSVYLARDLGGARDDVQVWMALVVFAFYPHLAYAQFARRKARDAELLNLLGDMVLIGVIANLLFFNPVLAGCYLIANSATNYAIRGIKFVIKGLVAFLAGVVLSLPLLGAELDTGYRLWELVPAFVYLIFATHYIGYVSYVRGVALIRARRRAEELADQDGLTGIANRRCFDQVLDQEWHRALRTGESVSLLLLDIDHFKAFNDQCGHPAGDDCLKRVATEIAGAVFRPGDLVARTGGEEFGVILPGADSAGAVTVARSILARIRELGIRHEASGTADVVTVSVGVATLTPAGDQTPRGLLLAADQALYQAKGQGRNQVCVQEMV